MWCTGGGVVVVVVVDVVDVVVVVVGGGVGVGGSGVLSTHSYLVMTSITCVVAMPPFRVTSH